MSNEPRETFTAKQTLVFYVKLAGLIAGLAAFGFVIYLLRRAL